RSLLSFPTRRSSDLANRVLGGPFTLEFWARLMQDPGVNSSILSDHGRVSGNTTGLSIEFPDNNSLNAVMGTGGSGWNTISAPTRSEERRGGKERRTR